MAESVCVYRAPCPNCDRVATFFASHRPDSTSGVDRVMCACVYHVEPGSVAVRLANTWDWVRAL